MKYICSLKTQVNEDFILEMSKLFNLDKHLVHLLYSRGIDTQNKLKKFRKSYCNLIFDML